MFLYILCTAYEELYCRCDSFNNFKKFLYLLDLLVVFLCVTGLVKADARFKDEGLPAYFSVCLLVTGFDTVFSWPSVPIT